MNAAIMLVAAAALTATEPAEGLKPAFGRAPNIILIMTDDQGYGDLGCHGNPIIRTPNLDRLHSQSVRLTDFHVSPTCSPTRCALMTGRHEFRSGVTHTIMERERMSLKAITLAQVLKQAGYATGVFGKWHLGDEDPYQPDRRGFDEVFIHGAGGIGQTYPGSGGDAPNNSYFDPAIKHNGKFVKTKGYCADVFFSQAIEWIARQKDRGRFFAYITPNTPHEPLICPEQYEKLYTGKVDSRTAAFYGMITNLDDNVGRLLQRLHEWGIEKDTLVIFMTDNGTANGERVFNAGMRGKKGTVYQGGTRVPSFWRWPGTLPAGVDVDKLTAQIDIFPTLAEMAGAPVPENVKLDGRSLVPLLRNPQADWPDRYLFIHLGRWPKGKAAESKYAHCAVRSTRFRLVNNKELYDIKADPGEQHNVIDQHPEVVAAMRQAYDRWWEEIIPCLENEDAVGPPVNPFKEQYWKQFGAGPPAAEQSKPSGAEPVGKPAGKTAKQPVQPEVPKRRPNVVFIITDDQRWDALSCEGHPHLKTPNLDRIAAEGARFRNAFVTCSLCSPSRASFLSGLYPHAHGVLDNFTDYPADLPSFPRRLHKAGYATAYIGKWHMGEEKDDPRPGFDYWASHKGQGQYYDTEFNINGQRQKLEGYYTHRVTDLAVDWLRRQGERPFLLILGHKAPHTPFTPEKKYLHLLDHANFPYPATAFALEDKPKWIQERLTTWHGIYGPLFGFRANFPDTRPEGVAEFTAFVRSYLATIKSVDDSTGRIYQALKEIGQLDNTLLVFASDNGFLLGEHGMTDKRTMHEPSIRIPLLVRYPPLVKPGTVIEQMVLNIDLAPSVLDICGVAGLGQVHGQSFKRLLEGKTGGWRTSWHYAYNYEKQFPYTPNVRGVRTEQWKYIHYPHGDGKPDRHKAELYNLREDPGETKNLIDDPRYAAVVEELKAELHRLMQQTGALPDKMPLDEGIKPELPEAKIR